MDAQKIMDEIGIFLDKSLLKKSKITRAEIIRFIEKNGQRLTMKNIAFTPHISMQHVW